MKNFIVRLFLLAALVVAFDAPAQWYRQGGGAVTTPRLRLEYMTPGVYTFTVPDNIGIMYLDGCSGGAGGGGGDPLVGGGGGGGGGSCIIQYPVRAVPGAWTVTVPTGGAGGAIGGFGGASSLVPLLLDNPSGVRLLDIQGAGSSTRGNPGTGAVGGAGGDGGVGGCSAIPNGGAAGTVGGSVTNQVACVGPIQRGAGGGGGGAAAATAGNCGRGNYALSACNLAAGNNAGGTGGQSFYYYGAIGGVAGAPGTDAILAGGGGGGGVNAAGGAGGPGFLRVYW